MNKLIKFNKEYDYNHTYCHHCRGYYGPCFGEPFCATCHAFICPPDPFKPDTTLYFCDQKADECDSGNEEPKDSQQDCLHPRDPLGGNDIYHFPPLEDVLYRTIVLPIQPQRSSHSASAAANGESSSNASVSPQYVRGIENQEQEPSINHIGASGQSSELAAELKDTLNVSHFPSSSTDNSVSSFALGAENIGENHFVQIKKFVDNVMSPVADEMMTPESSSSDPESPLFTPRGMINRSLFQLLQQRESHSSASDSNVDGALNVPSTSSSAVSSAGATGRNINNGAGVSSSQSVTADRNEVVVHQQDNEPHGLFECNSPNGEVYLACGKKREKGSKKKAGSCKNAQKYRNNISYGFNDFEFEENNSRVGSNCQCSGTNGSLLQERICLLTNYHRHDGSTSSYVTHLLPPEVWIMVFELLDDVSLWQCTRVSRNWRELILRNWGPDKWKQFTNFRWRIFKPLFKCKYWHAVYTSLMESSPCKQCHQQMFQPLEPIALQGENSWRMNRLKTELNSLSNDPPEGIEAVPLDVSSLIRWQAAIRGPNQSPYMGGVFFLHIIIPPKYPLTPPVVRFVTKIFHPNVSCHGDIGIDSIQHNWSLALTISKVLISIQSLLTDPYTKVCMDPRVGALYENDREKFNKIATEWTWRYAMNDTLDPKPSPEELMMCETVTGPFDEGVFSSPTSAILDEQRQMDDEDHELNSQRSHMDVQQDNVA